MATMREFREDEIFSRRIVKKKKKKVSQQQKQQQQKVFQMALHEVGMKRVEKQQQLHHLYETCVDATSFYLMYS